MKKVSTKLSKASKLWTAPLHDTHSNTINYIKQGITVISHIVWGVVWPYHSMLGKRVLHKLLMEITELCKGEFLLNLPTLLLLKIHFWTLNIDAVFWAVDSGIFHSGWVNNWPHLNSSVLCKSSSLCTELFLTMYSHNCGGQNNFGQDVSGFYLGNSYHHKWQQFSPTFCNVDDSITFTTLPFQH